MRQPFTYDVYSAGLLWLRLCPLPATLPSAAPPPSTNEEEVIGAACFPRAQARLARPHGGGPVRAAALAAREAARPCPREAPARSCPSACPEPPLSRHDLAAWRIDAAAADALPDAWESAFPLDGEAWQLLCGLMAPVPADRPVAAEALLSPFLNADCHSTGEPTPAPLPWTLDAVVAGTTAAPRRIVAEECGLD